MLSDLFMGFALTVVHPLSPLLYATSSIYVKHRYIVVIGGGTCLSIYESLVVSLISFMIVTFCVG